MHNIKERINSIFRAIRSDKGVEMLIEAYAKISQNNLPLTLIGLDPTRKNT